jgi:hypothetical protein
MDVVNNVFDNTGNSPHGHAIERDLIIREIEDSQAKISRLKTTIWNGNTPMRVQH